MKELFLQAVRLKSAEELGYVARIPAIRHLKRLVFPSQVTFFVGENGSGKSTLLEGIAVAMGFNPEGGTLNFSFSTSDTHSRLWGALTLERGIHRPRDGFFLRAESFFNVATELERIQRDDPGKMALDAYGGRSLHSQSHGESFLTLVLERFGGSGLYLLDEPEAALSPQSQLTLLSAIHQLVKEGSQLIIATHSPILMAYPQAEILVLSDNSITPTPYEETEHYRLTKQFLDHPQQILRQLLKEEAEGSVPF